MKTILITGSTDGVGKLTALKLAKDGHQLILHGRNSEKLNDVITEIVDQTGNKEISGYISDLSDFHSIDAMAAEVANDYSSIDVLINNAGVFLSRIERNSLNLDIRFAVNYFAPYILTNKLLPLLEQGDSPRVINLSSAAQSTISWEAFQGNEQAGAQSAYAQSKLALTMWSFHLSKQFDSLNVIAVNPGSLLNTKMVQEAYGQHWSSVDKGADVLCELAISVEHGSMSGKYFDNDQGHYSNAHGDAYDDNKIAQLIEETEKILNRS